MYLYHQKWLDSLRKGDYHEHSTAQHSTAQQKLGDYTQVEKLDLTSKDILSDNIAKIGQLFPEVLTESSDENGRLRPAIDFEKLRQLLSREIVEGRESYEFTWVGKRGAIAEAGKPTSQTLRPDLEESVDFDKSENIFITGDNLEVLKVLQESYLGKIDMIYIDPPYNTGSDSFNYNDNFNHSTWLTFMKNRLEVARELLANDGAIYVSIDDKEQAYLKVLMNEVFGKENFLTQFNFQVRYADKSISTETMAFKPLIEYTLMYAKDFTHFKANQPTVPYTDDKFVWEIREMTDGRIEEIAGNKVGIFKKGEWELVRVESNLNALKETWISGSIYSKMSYGQVYQKIVEPRVELDGNGTLYKVYGRGEDGLGYRYYANPQKANANRGKMYSGMPLERKEEIQNGTAVKYLPIVNFADFAGDFGNIRHEGGVALNSGKKPEKLLKMLLEYVTLEGDLVLDFFGGSGSTAATAHKMNRQYISIEQMYYIEDKIVERLNNVIQGDATGISKDVNWTGGGSFVYAELKNDAHDFKNTIVEATSTGTLLELFERAKKSSFLSYRIDPKKLKTSEFEKLSLAEQKQLLSELVDNNNLYVNYSDIDDSDYQISADDKRLNHAFYGKEK